MSTYRINPESYTTGASIHRSALRALKAKRQQRQDQTRQLALRPKAKQSTIEEASSSYSFAGGARTRSISTASSTTSRTSSNELSTSYSSDRESSASSATTAPDPDLAPAPQPTFPRRPVWCSSRNCYIVDGRTPGMTLCYYEKQQVIWQRALRTRARMFGSDAVKRGSDVWTRHAGSCKRRVERLAREIE